MADDPPEPAVERNHLVPRNTGEPRWMLIRDLAVFQGKLLLDGLRDALLAPLALAAGIIGLISGRDASHNLFYSTLRIGWRFEKWINLFGAVEPPDPEENAPVDQMVERIERILTAQAQKEGVTKATKARIDAVLDKIQRRGS